MESELADPLRQNRVVLDCARTGFNPQQDAQQQER
jgi:hypothetical protein